MKIGIALAAPAFGCAKLNNSIASPERELWSAAFARAVRGLPADERFTAILNGAEASRL